MITALRRFAEGFDVALKPLLGPIDALAKELEGLPEGAPPRALIAELGAHRQRAELLARKVAQQQAYVVIFGPLKSGKSTLMNGISRAYVSEVTALPAYPCMVFVAHADERQVRVTRYDGTSESFADPAATEAVIADAHAELARALRDADARGEEFEPLRHLPRAIERIDVRMPAPELRESGALLVDTPGLYSRMKFGYDQMTREFRLAAASAIFVVKTENLFLEQVFSEFAELLRLFSRIFLVVNLDSAKQDLAPDGGLRPSLESLDPAQIVAAFERLSMSAELKKAWEEGRLGIYPIDLLRAASDRLRAPADSAAAPGDGAAEAAAERHPEFTRLLGDLTAYLDGCEAQNAFVRDSLRQGQDLAIDLRLLGRSEPARLLLRNAEEAQAAHDHLVDRRHAAQRLTTYEWEEAFERLREDIGAITRERGGTVRKTAVDAAEAALERWFEGDASLAALLRDDLGAALTGCRDQLTEIAYGVARTVVGSDLAAASVRRGVSDDIATLGLPVTEVSRAALDDAAIEPPDKSPLMHIPLDLIPVRRGFLDWILLRNPAAVRRRVFGPEEAPERPIPRRVKQRRLGAAARAALSAAIRVRVDRFFSDTTSQLGVTAFATAVGAVGRKLRAQVEFLRAQNEEALVKAERRLAAATLLRDRTADLLAVSERTGAELGALAEAQHAVALQRPPAGISDDGRGAVDETEEAPTSLSSRGE
jgi:dynamin family protein